MNNLSVHFWVTLWGLNQGVAVMFFRKRGLSGGTTQRRTAVWASCPVELSLYSGLATHQSVSSLLPEAWAETISRDLWFLDISNGLIVAANARSIASPVRPWMNQYPGVNRHISASLSKTFIWHFSMLHLTDSDQPVWNSQQRWEFCSFRNHHNYCHKTGACRITYSNFEILLSYKKELICILNLKCYSTVIKGCSNLSILIMQF